MKKYVLKLLVWSLCISAFLAIIVILLLTFGEMEIEIKILTTAMLVFAYLMFCLCSLTIYEKKELRLFSIIGVTSSLISCLYLVGFLWEIIDLDSHFQWQFIFSLNILCLSSAHISLILLIDNNNYIVSLFRSFTVFISIAIDIMILLLIWDLFETGDFYFRLMWVLAILIAFGTFTTPILNKIYKNSENVNSSQINIINNQNLSVTNEQTNINSNSKKSTKKIILSIAIIIIICSFCFYYVVNHSTFIKNQVVDEKNQNIKEVLDNIPSSTFYDTSDFYFIYNDRIYYYTFKENFGDYIDRLYAMDLDGSNNKLIAETEELRYAHFYFVYNDEAYFYTVGSNKKINLNTGKLIDLNSNEIFIAKSLNNGFVTSYIAHVYDNDFTLKKIDLKTNKTLTEIKIKYNINDKEYFFDSSGGNIFYLERFYSKYPSIYKNNEIIYEFVDYTRYTFDEIEFIACNNDYIYFKQNYYIYKLNINTKEIEKEIDYKLGDIHRISSGNNLYNYFYVSNKIYSFDFERDEFDLILKDVTYEPEEVYYINNKLIFTENTNNLGYNPSYNKLGNVIVYDLEENRNVNSYGGIRKVSFDNNHMYLVFYGEDNYYIDKVSLVD